MKRFFALLGGLLTLPAFAENALVYRDEVIASRGYDGGVDAENVSATSAGRTSRRGDVVAGRSISRALPTAATAPVSNRNAAAGRVVASSCAGVVAPSAVSSAPRVATRMAGAAPTRATTTDAVRTGVSTRRTAVPDANALNASRVATAVGSRVRARIANVSAKVGGDSVVSVSNSAESTPVVTAETVASLTSTMDSVAEMTSFCKAQYTECMEDRKSVV